MSWLEWVLSFAKGLEYLFKYVRIPKKPYEPNN